ncbi:hypothetical protein ABZX65_02940 [Streptomyces sp. NPDC003300]|uniref:hypothetical protein n=1 Tax=unclassified Streptomyces TaxID=2593676 RepID=UPI0033ABEDE3
MADRTGTDRAELPERLRDAAGSHRPDRERMLARVEQGMAERDMAGHGMAEPSRTGGRSDGHGGGTGAPWMRIAAVTAAVAGAIGLGGLAVGAVTGNGEPTQSVVTSGGPGVTHSATSSPVGTDSPAAQPRSPAASSHPSGRHGGTGGTRPTGTPSGGASSPTGTPPSSAATTSGIDGGAPGSVETARNGTLTARGSVDSASNDYWTQSDVVLTTGKPLTTLSVELRVARTEGVSSTGSWTSVSGGTNPTVTVEGAELVYRWTLDADNTLAPGTYTFSGQFNHAAGARATGGDTYTARWTGPDGTSSVDGGF